MQIIVDSLTGMGRRFADSLGLPVIDIKDSENIPADERLFLITRCYNFGQIPETTTAFLKKHHHQVAGCAVSGNRNWGSNFAIVGDKLEVKYGFPCIVKFEGTGFPAERQAAKDFLAACGAEA